MKLILIRHGEALEREKFIKLKNDDSLRPLILKGRRKSLQMAQMLSEWIGTVDLLVSSPYLRAKQTALIFQRVIKTKKAIEVVELIPSAPPMAFSQWLSVHAGAVKSIAVVGHEPQLSLFASWVLAGQAQSFIDLKKSGVIGIEVESFKKVKANSGKLKFLITPKMFD